MIDDRVYLNKKEVVARLPLMTIHRLNELMREGKGPMHARGAKGLVFRSSDVDAWYAKYEDEMFKSSQKRVAKPRRTTKAAELLA